MLGEELSVDVGHLAHETRVTSRSGRAVARTRRRRGKSGAAASTRSRTSGSACSVQATPTRAPRAIERPRLESGHERREHRLAAVDVARQRPGVVEARREREAAVHRDEADVGLKPTTPQQAAGMRIEPPESVPSAASASPRATAAAEPPLDPPAMRPGARVRHVAEVRVLAT